MKQRIYMAKSNVDPTGFEKFVFPMIRAIWLNLVAEELINVQPMTAKFPFFIEDPEIIALNDLIDKAEEYYKEKKG